MFKKNKKGLTEQIQIARLWLLNCVKAKLVIWKTNWKMLTSEAEMRRANRTLETMTSAGSLISWDEGDISLIGGPSGRKFGNKSPDTPGGSLGGNDGGFLLNKFWMSSGVLGVESSS